MIYFGFYHNIKGIIPKAKNKFEDYTYRSIAGFAGLATFIESILNKLNFCLILSWIFCISN